MDLAIYNLLAQEQGTAALIFTLMLMACMLLITLSVVIFVAKRYRRCPSDQVLVIYGKVGGGRAAKALHGGGTFVFPIIQDYAYLSLEPYIVPADAPDAVTKDEKRVSVQATVTVCIPTDDPALIDRASERLLGLSAEQIQSQAAEIVLGQMRRVLANRSTDEIRQDREALHTSFEEQINADLNKIGLTVVSFNIREITGDSGST